MKIETAEEIQKQNEEELKVYDGKVYRASEDMVRAMTLELQKLCVPFFGTRSECLIASALVCKGNDDNLPKDKITEERLRELQRRMLQYLEDMYKE